jgi:alpha-beta hydrolase superfamily lysophospholipase
MLAEPRPISDIRKPMTEERFHLIAQDGVHLQGALWAPAKPTAAMLWLHGFAEHRLRYRHFGGWMAERGVATAAIDFRGHGESGGKRGFIRSFVEYLYDARVLAAWVIKNFPDMPIVLGAHSNGGLIAARFLQEEKELAANFACAVFTSPFFDVALPVPPWKVKLANALGKILPGLSVPAGISAELVSHDPAIVTEYRTDPLVFKTATARWYTETVQNQRIALERAPEVTLPLLVMQGLADGIVNPKASRQFFDSASSKDKHWIEYEGLYHEILNETSREKVYADLYNWLKKRI